MPMLDLLYALHFVSGVTDRAGVGSLSVGADCECYQFRVPSYTNSGKVVPSRRMHCCMMGAL